MECCRRICTGRSEEEVMAFEVVAREDTKAAKIAAEHEAKKVKEEEELKETLLPVSEQDKKTAKNALEREYSQRSKFGTVITTRTHEERAIVQQVMRGNRPAKEWEAYIKDQAKEVREREAREEKDFADLSR